MRSLVRVTPGVLLVGLILAGCSGNNDNDFKPPDHPDKPVVATVTLDVPGMT